MEAVRKLRAEQKSDKQVFMFWMFHMSEKDC